MDSRDRAAILLAGLPKLNSTLTLQIHEPLRQRIVMNYNLEGLTKDEGKTYILEKLKVPAAIRPSLKMQLLKQYSTLPMEYPDL